MFSGTIVVSSKIPDPSIQFSSFEFDAGHPQITKATLSSVDSHEVTSTIELEGLSSVSDLVDAAVTAHTKTLLCLGWFYGFVLGETTSKVITFKSATNSDDDIVVLRGVVATASVGEVSVIVDRSPPELAAALTKRSALADMYFELFHQARTSTNNVVEFLGYYQIVAYTLNEPAQRVIDEFFLKHGNPKPAVFPKPGKGREGSSNGDETVYTRLRNEIAHVRYLPGTMTLVNLADTRAGIASHVRGLRHLAKIAIQEAIKGSTEPINHQ